VLQAVVLMLAIYEDAYWLLASAIVLGLFQIALVVDHFRLTQRVKSFSLMDQVVAEPLGRTVSRVTSVTPEAPARAGAGAAMAAALLGLSPDAVIIWEVDSKEVVYWNRAAERLYGYSHDEAVGQPRHHLLQTPPPEALAAIESRAGEVGVWGAQVRQRCRDGRFVEVTCRMSAISNPQARLLVLEVNREIRNESG
jgi:PAS domain S-box-containing protein